VKRFRWASLVIVVLGVLVWGYLQMQSRASGPRYLLAHVERGPLRAIVSANGTLNAVVAVQVGSQVSGQIKELLVDFNSKVRKGEVIARLDPASFEAKVRQARADLDSVRAAVLNQQAQVERARADVENAHAALAEAEAQTARADVAAADAGRDLERRRSLFERQLIPLSERDTAQALYDTALTQVRAARARERSLTAAVRSARAQLKVADAALTSARAQVVQKQAALDQALVDLNNTVIKAPIDGIVVSRSVDNGQTVAASLQAPTLFTIAQNLDSMQVETSVVEADIGRVKVDDEALFTVDAFPRDTFRGRVVQIRKAPQNVQNVVTYVVLVAVTNPGGKLLPGMTANVRLVVDRRENTLKVPNAALRFRGEVEGEAEKKPETAAAREAGTGDVRSAGDSTRARLAQSLGLTKAQEAKLDAILEETRRQRRALGDGMSEDERQEQAKSIRQARRERIREILTPDQRARFDQGVGRDAVRDEASGVSGRVWVLGRGGQPTPVAVRLGVTDGKVTEVLEGDLSEGQEVIVGRAVPEAVPGPPASAPGAAPRIRL
jgi:HlyD family secretion protein